MELIKNFVMKKLMSVIIMNEITMETSAGSIFGFIFSFLNYIFLSSGLCR
ncbi:hypothetical protein FIC_02221 [Flavobacteriaceae bacterium 3519-10]|nr:hypothetical protein FIC_02221 [Flavobacteriaceae bacterium 3519-10]